MKYKHKKTRKQKIIADYRHQVYSLENKNILLNIPTPVMSVDKSSSYAYVLNDIFKTGLLTFCIIALELVLFFVLKKHIFSIPNLSY